MHLASFSCHFCTDSDTSCIIWDEDMEKPFIAVVNSWTKIVPGHIHLREIANAVKEGIRDAEGLPFEFNTIAVCDGLAMEHGGMRYSRLLFLALLPDC